MIKSINYMKSYFSWKKPAAALFVLAGLTLASCNKDVPGPTAIPMPVPTGNTIGDIVNSDANFSYLRAALTRAGMLTAVQDRNARFTVFAPDNTAFNRLFAALGLPQAEATVGALPLAQLAGILQYHVIPGQVVTSTMIPETFPNTFMPTLVQASNTSPLLKLMNFPSRRGASAFVDNIPVAQADITAANGVIHRMAGVLLPPNTTTIWQALNADPNYSYLVAAITRADLGMPANSKIVNLLNTASPYANFTLFAPNNAAFDNLFIALGVAAPTINTVQLLSINSCINICAYHVMIRGVLNPTTSPAPDLIRVFSTNLPATATQTPTFLNMLAATAPRLTVSTAGIKGNSNATNAAINRANWHNLNGVIHGVDQVLRP
jgi:uncharacterized surface protein with fasciclin (FAS1) repeats